MQYQYPDSKLIIFAKVPAAGKVKTRLIPYLGTERATQLQCQLIEQTLAMACSSQLAPVELWLAGDQNHPLIHSIQQHYRIQLRLQQGDDLGQRMYHAIEHTLIMHKSAVLIGTDCPVMDKGLLNEAFASLENSELVFSPAEDGGYTLVGLSVINRRIFEGIDWGSDQVMNQSLTRADYTKLDTRLLRTTWDIDREEDYIRAINEGLI
ncbi:MAG: TIGR04282 family arsenosugar biosynthesis glycosyltransferase [Gammaproteobacteria bacterium]|nr:TIGR04282 family arsenosugar biosynthesis glycosyltransferase [Gammaproteobacteria bacterium]